MGTPASSFKLWTNAPQGRKRFPIRRLAATALHALLLPFCAGQYAYAQPVGSKVEQITKPNISQAPAEFKSRLAEIEKTIKKKGGFAVAGQVEDEKKFFPKPGQFAVALKYNDSNAEDTYKFNDGWFISRAMSSGKSDRYNILVVASFYHFPVEESLTIEEGQVIWAKATLQGIPAENKTSISGIVTDEEGKPVTGANVVLTINRSNGYFDSQARRSETTNAQGKYSFTGITFQPYGIDVTKTGYTYSFAKLEPAKSDSSASPFARGTTANALPKQSGVLIMRTPWAKGGERSSDANNANFILAYPRAITIDYVYKTENKFNWQDATTHVVWDGVKGMNFSKGLDERGQDLNLESKEGAPFFRHFFVRSGGGHGHYDLGEVSFDSVKEIDEAKADALQDTPCVLNHVYGVRTYEGKYAKFVVRKIVAIHPR